LKAKVQQTQRKFGKSS